MSLLCYAQPRSYTTKLLCKFVRTLLTRLISSCRLRSFLSMVAVTMRRSSCITSVRIADTTVLPRERACEDILSSSAKSRMFRTKPALLLPAEEEDDEDEEEEAEDAGCAEETEGPPPPTLALDVVRVLKLSKINKYEGIEKQREG